MSTHGHPHTHDHGRHMRAHDVGPGRLRLVLVLTAGFMVAEVAGGLLSNSLALLADAGHMLTDAGAIALSLFAIRFARLPATDEKTFGYYRLEILAALVNGAALLVIAGFIVVEAWRRIFTPEPIAGGLMLVVATLGLGVNLVAAWLLHGASHESLNVRGAYLHVLGDLLGSVGAIAAALVVLLTGWLPADPIISVIVALLILVSAWRLVRESVDVLLEAVPAHIDLAGVRAAMIELEPVDDVHDLHVWTLTSGYVALSAHAVVADPADNQRVLGEIRDCMERRFGIRHVTVQIERQSLYQIGSAGAPPEEEARDPL
ncbi:MAG: cation diffusion facilitator family transporter [Gemmatimonadota bacterium]